MAREPRELTREEQNYINHLSAKSPQLAIRMSKFLKHNSYRVGGKTMFFSTPKDEKTSE